MLLIHQVTASKVGRGTALWANAISAKLHRLLFASRPTTILVIAMRIHFSSIFHSRSTHAPRRRGSLERNYLRVIALGFKLINRVEKLFRIGKRPHEAREAAVIKNRFGKFQLR